MTAAKPIPILDVWNKPFWDACSDKKLRLQQCSETGKVWYPPAPVSPYAPRAEWTWVDCSGRAEIISWVIFHHNYFPGFAGELPYNVALVRLEEGALLLTNIVGGNDGLTMGAPVNVMFEDRGDVVVPVFTLSGEAA